MSRALIIMLLALFGCACTSQRCDKPSPYQESRDGRGLVIPEDLSRPPVGGARIPDVDSDAPPSRGPCGEKPPSPPIGDKPRDKQASS